MAEVVLIDGLQGCGKTTVSAFLRDQLMAMGKQCVVIKEDARDLAGMPYGTGQYRGVDDYMGTAVARWVAFTQEHRDKNVIVIIDGRFLMGCIASLLRHNVARQAINAHILESAAAISPLKPILFYLHVLDYRPVFTAMCRRRGKQTEQIYVERNDKSSYAASRKVRGFEGLLSFWLEYRRIAYDLVARLGTPKLMIDIADGEWDRHRQEMLQFLRPHLEEC